MRGAGHDPLNRGGVHRSIPLRRRLDSSHGPHRFAVGRGNRDRLRGVEGMHDFGRRDGRLWIGL